MKSKHNREGPCSHQFVICVKAVGCRDYPGASNQGATALGADVILALVLVPDQSCYPGVGILLCISAPDDPIPSITQVACQPTAASSVAVDCGEGKSSDGQVCRVLGEERLLVLL